VNALLSFLNPSGGRGGMQVFGDLLKGEGRKSKELCEPRTCTPS